MNPLGILLKYRWQDFTLRDTDPADLGQGLWFCVSNQLSGDTDHPQTTL